MKAFVGLLACFLTITSAALVPPKADLLSLSDDIREILQEIDPARISDVSLTLLDRITLSLASASVSDFSKFSVDEVSNDGSNVRLALRRDALNANVDDLAIRFIGGLSAGLQLDVSITGVTLDVSASYTTSPLRLTALSMLHQVQGISIEGQVTLNDNAILDISVGNELAEWISKGAVERREEISGKILKAVNKILAVIDP